MTYLLTLACTLLIGGGSPSSTQAATQLSGDFRWVRGAVAAASPTSLTLKLADGALTLTVDPSTEVITARPAVMGLAAGAPARSLAIGTLVRVHYIDKQEKRAVVIVVDDATAAPLSLLKRAGTSVRGEVNYVKSRTVAMRIDHRSRDLILDDHTTLLDRDGHALATGRKAIAGLLAAGVDVLVTWAPFWVMEGDGSVTSYYRNAIEIRALTPVPGPARLLAGGSQTVHP